MIQIRLTIVQVEGENQDISRLPKGPWEFNSREHMESQLYYDAKRHGANEIRVDYYKSSFVWIADDYLAAKYELTEV